MDSLPKIISLSAEGDMFEILNTDVSVVNSLRRVILTRIPMLVFRGFPHAANQINIKKNKSKFNNEYIKHRIQCIPIHEEDDAQFSAMVGKYSVHAHVINDTNEPRYVTTKDFKLLNMDTGKTIDEAQVRRLFPPDQITQDLIPVCVLLPKISDTDEPEEIDMTLHFSIGTAKEDSCWNTVSKCTYYNKPDKTVIDKEAQLRKEEDRKDFLLLDAQRLYIPNHFVFNLETIGVFTNQAIVFKACNYLKDSLSELQIYLTQQTKLSSGNRLTNTPEPFELFMDETSSKPVYVMRIENDDYTIGKLIEKHLDLMFSKDIYYVSFKKDHPHDQHCFISFAYRTETSLDVVIGNLVAVVAHLIRVYESISTYFRK